MDVFRTDRIRNVVLLGHGGAGKTTLAEAMAYLAGMTNRLGRVEDGNTVSDYDKEEIKRHFSISTTLIPVPWDKVKINVLDTPGYFDFVGEVEEAVSVADAAIIVVNCKAGIEVGTEKAWELCEEYRLPRIIFVTNMDDDHASFRELILKLEKQFGRKIAPFQVPIRENEKFVGFVNAVKMEGRRFTNLSDYEECEIPEYTKKNLGIIRDALIEAVAETSEEYMERYFSGEEFTQKERVDGIHKGMRDGTITPVACVSAQMLEGVDLLCKEMELLVPEASDEIAALNQNGEEVVLHQSPEEPVCVQVYQTLADPYVGKLSMMRVISGTLKAGAELVNSKTGATEKLNKLFFLCGKKQTETAVAEAGDLVAATKLSANTGDTLCDSSRVVSLPRSSFPTPCYSMAVRPAARGDEAKVAAAIQKILEEDQTLSYQQNPATNEMILSGLGEQHLSAVISKLKADFGVDVVLSVPKIAYRETIRKKVKVQGKYKKQSGGHGQYGDVWIEFEPYPSEELVFEEKVFGGAVPRNFFPAVEKGLQESYTKGVLAGFPVVGVKAILVDGSYHPVDSSETNP